MDVKGLRKVILINVLLFVGLQNATALLKDGELHTDDGNNVCTVKLDTCKLKVADYPLLEPGEKGKEGPRGPQGPVGPPGKPGRNGVCPCNITPAEKASYDNEDIAEFGTLVGSICKAAPDNVISGNFQKGPPSGVFTVYCNMTTKETCIRRNGRTRLYEYSSENGTTWLSSASIELRELYDLTQEQISWLQSMSMTARQTLRYHCVDSVPYPKLNLTASVKLLGWNDAIIEPFPTTQHPFYYSVPPETDGCVEGNTEWNSTLIEIVSSNVFRLPITDVWIGDVRGSHQKMAIESVELCFG